MCWDVEIVLHAGIQAGKEHFKQTPDPLSYTAQHITVCECVSVCAWGYSHHD